MVKATELLTLATRDSTGFRDAIRDPKSSKKVLEELVTLLTVEIEQLGTNATQLSAAQRTVSNLRVGNQRQSSWEETRRTLELDRQLVRDRIAELTPKKK